MFFLPFLLDDRRIRIRISDSWIRMRIRMRIRIRNTGTLLCAFRLAAFAHGCPQIPHTKPNHIRFILDKFTVPAKTYLQSPNFKLLRSPRIAFKEPIPPGCVAGTTILTQHMQEVSYLPFFSPAGCVTAVSEKTTTGRGKLLS
jgi:hypothetical protein